MVTFEFNPYSKEKFAGNRKISFLFVILQQNETGSPRSVALFDLPDIYPLLFPQKMG